uniref:NADH-ubiquinone oxidoreductase chain 2 n=1 Tax=Paratrichobius longicrus TaxID=402416 RepID=A0A5B9RGM6_9MUSC|nr:NADH dehydrogenase subunit 2 [Paratrichobius longicrus]QEG77644.1 NADH dehydrogenase subunit 2 [Paratrichobius longicrus]
MFNNSSKLIFMIMLMISTIFIISSNSWITMWMGMEINLLSFIPLMSNNKLMSSEASLKYFLIQTFASSIMLMSMIMTMNYQLILFKMLIMMSILLKMGAAPFHFWMPIIMEGMSWNNSLLLLTWQKIAPMIMISYMMINKIMFMSITLSAFIGAIGGLNQTSLRKLMAYSSINHMSWMLMSIMYSHTMWLMYFLIYSIIMLTIIINLNSMKISHMNQLFSSFYYNKTLKFLFMMNLLSMGGLPPFSGFLPKWMLINFMINNNQFLMLFLLIIFSLITLFYYLRLCFASFMLNYSENNWNNFCLNNKTINITLTSLSLFSLLLLPLYFLL